jgi:hypothetical protein
MASRMEGSSALQIETRNSLRRRNALVSSCACMRLESAMRTEIGFAGCCGTVIEKITPHWKVDVRSRSTRTQGNLPVYLRDDSRIGKQDFVVVDKERDSGGFCVVWQDSRHDWLYTKRFWSAAFEGNVMQQTYKPTFVGKSQGDGVAVLRKTILAN